MYQVSYMTNNGKDKWSIHETLEGAKEEAKLLQAKFYLEKIYCWNISKIIEGSEPHWTEDCDNE